MEVTKMTLRYFVHAIGASLLVTFALGSGTEDIGNANDYVDEILNNFRNEHSLIAKVDPLEIPAFSIDKIEGWDGIVRGLSSLYRHGDCSLLYDGETISVSCEIAVKDVTIDMKYKTKTFIKIKGKVNAYVEKLAVSLEVSSNNGVTTLKSFKVKHLGDYKVKKITGLSNALNWLLKIIVNNIAKKSRGDIIKAIENEAAAALEKELSKVAFPLQVLAFSNRKSES